MASNTNWIIGQGENLIEKISLKTGGGDKAYPYEYEDAVERLEDEIEYSVSQINQLPSLACPNDEAVLALTLHPSFLAKTYHPTSLLKTLGLRQVGSRETRIRPGRHPSAKKANKKLVAAELFIAGPRSNIELLCPDKHPTQTQAFQDDFRKIEAIRSLGSERLKSHQLSGRNIPLEVVLHFGQHTSNTNLDTIAAFERWCDSILPKFSIEHTQIVGGLAFLGLRANAEYLEHLTKFSFLRLIRRMPRLTFRDFPSEEATSENLIDLSKINPTGSSQRVAILDGGLDEKHPFNNLVTVREPSGIGSPSPFALAHGAKVTSAALFGSIDNPTSLPTCFSNIDHWRVYDEGDKDFDLMKVLDRVTTVLTQNRYDIACLSIGPDEALLDDDVHAWTSRLDQISANGQTLIIAAAGNNGEEDASLGLNRIQPSADGVNVLAVGSKDSVDNNWRRCSYSAVGPGRSPGLVKPDILAFGGTKNQPFIVINGQSQLSSTAGTSYSAPSAARIAAGLASTFSDQITPTALKALLIHHASENGHNQIEVGWGSIPNDITALMTCKDNEATVIYQGFLEPTRHMRFPLPMPNDGFRNKVSIKATFVVSTPVDPEDAINYTRTGVGISFRPSTVGHPGFHSNGNERSTHEPRTFFGKSQIFKTEQELRDDAARWETVRKRIQNFRAKTLNRPVFDIEHLARQNGRSATRSNSIPYALIATIQEIKNNDLYNSIIRTYGNRLKALEPRIEITAKI
ncbi:MULTISPECIES: S8 family peptidase [unclassified Pseudovibrio]|uniref:S8 family peptidase n=1 Tax=unclassified Pseudovibrio TaxID=2627060 RepID=UPI0007AE5387|nr:MULTISPECIES: S8 family peptidase [unclassified Pseudovibrio]KZL00472.1 Subtilase family protein [Pseudovibrio sp. W74]KZL07472.1 Subtilase family protein [Pseudovibrio sp. Ad14]